MHVNGTASDYYNRPCAVMSLLACAHPLQHPTCVYWEAKIGLTPSLSCISISHGRKLYTLRVVVVHVLVFVPLPSTTILDPCLPRPVQGGTFPSSSCLRNFCKKPMRSTWRAVSFDL